MTDLAKKDCIPCKGGVAALEGVELERLLEQLGNDWALDESQHLVKDYKFQNFREALDFTTRVGEMAEEQQHHPDLYLAWGKVKIIIWTHKIDGLTESDFVFAAKSEQLLGA